MTLYIFSQFAIFLVIYSYLMFYTVLAATQF